MQFERTLSALHIEGDGFAQGDDAQQARNSGLAVADQPGSAGLMYEGASLLVQKRSAAAQLTETLPLRWT